MARCDLKQTPMLMYSLSTATYSLDKDRSFIHSTWAGRLTCGPHFISLTHFVSLVLCICQASVDTTALFNSLNTTISMLDISFSMIANGWLLNKPIEAAFQPFRVLPTLLVLLPLDSCVSTLSLFRLPRHAGGNP